MIIIIYQNIYIKKYIPYKKSNIVFFLSIIFFMEICAGAIPYSCEHEVHVNIHSLKTLNLQEIIKIIKRQKVNIYIHNYG